MSRSKAIAVLFYLGAMLIGAAVGIAVDRQLVPARLSAMQQDPRNMRERFFADLKFTPAQRAAFDSIWAARRHADSAILAPISAQLTPIEAQRDSLRKATNASIRALLTQEQLKLYDARQSRPPRSNDGRR